MDKVLRAAPALAAAVLVAACTVHQADTPGLAGPSEFGVSVSMSASPDTLTQNGSDRSTIVVSLRGPNNQPMPNQTLHLDIVVDGVIEDFGTLSTKTIATGSDGSAVAVYTAPPAPPPGGTAGGYVSIAATRVATDQNSSVSNNVLIRLVPEGIILPPGDTPTPKFTWSPLTVNLNVPVTFDASSSCAGSKACSSPVGIASFVWDFGDGGSATGMTVSHTFTSVATFNVKLTVTNTSGVPASTTQSVDVGSTGAPTADFVFSPQSPTTADVVQFNADPSTSAVGHNITAYSWNFGDGQSASGRTASHQYTVPGVYTVSLSVTDDTGQRAVTTQQITVTP
jgi:PKD repeat protein